MVNVNIEIPDELHKKLKLAAVLEDTTIKSIVIEVLSAVDDK
jgi:hypothetical protein